MLGCAGRGPLVAGPVRITTHEPPSAIERYEALWRFDQENQAGMKSTNSAPSSLLW